MDGSKYVPHRKVKQLLGVSDSTIRRWAKIGKIEFITTQFGYRLYHVPSILLQKETVYREEVCYCRVSTKKQAKDLDRQIKFCKEKFPNFRIIKDISSALNWNRKGFTSLLDGVLNGTIKTVVVTHKDRLCRFGFELLQHIFDKNKTKIMVLNQDSKNEHQELAEDILSIITVFSAKYYGKRSYSSKSKKDKIISVESTESII